jgi:hypothetical protein
MKNSFNFVDLFGVFCLGLCVGVVYMVGVVEVLGFVCR